MRDGAVTNALSTTLLLGLTLGAVGVAALQMSSNEMGPEPPPELRLSSVAAAGDGAVSLIHQGGSALDTQSLVAIVSVDGKVVHRDTVAGHGPTWASGETLRVPLPAALPAGSLAEVTIVDEARGRVLGTTRMLLPETPANAGDLAGFVVTPGVSGAVSGELIPGKPIRFDVVPDHPEGRKYIRYVYADLTALGGAAWVELADDGTNGDRVASDGVFGGVAIVPAAAPSGSVSVTVHAVDLAGERAQLEVMFDLPPPPVTPPTPPPPPIPREPCFRIRPDGGVEPLAASALAMEVVGVDITYGRDGPRIPVTAWATFDGGRSLRSLYGGGPVARGMTESFTVALGDIVGVRGRAEYESFRSTRDSWVSAPQVRVLKDGDVPPDVPAFGTIQQDIAVYLAPYVVDGKIRLEYDEAIVLVEFVTDITSAAADFQDLVVLYDFECPAPDPAAGPSGTGAPLAGGGAPTFFPGSTNLPCTGLPGGLGWSELKVDPPRAGTYTSGALTVTLTNVTAKSFDWTSNVGVDAVYVKAGSEGSNLYAYVPEATSGTQLISPGSEGNAISHISFCFD